jgi:hypothetical protein
MNNRLQLSEGVFVYALGVAIIATRPGRFWLGMALAIVPILIGPVGRLIGGQRWRRL